MSLYGGGYCRGTRQESLPRTQELGHARIQLTRVWGPESPEASYQQYDMFYPFDLSFLPFSMPGWGGVRARKEKQQSGGWRENKTSRPGKKRTACPLQQKSPGSQLFGKRGGVLLLTQGSSVNFCVKTF